MPTTSGCPLRYAVEHVTRYDYGTPVVQSWQLARLTPRELPWQRVLAHRVQIDPPPDERHDTVDCHGNRATHFAIHRAHRLLQVRMECLVDVAAPPAFADPSRADPDDGAASWSWEAVREAVWGDPSLDDLGAARLCHPTRLVPGSEAARAFASRHLAPGREWGEAVGALMRAIHEGFVFEPGATTVSTPVDQVLRERRGVCQDFAHVMLACLRSHGLAARYVSGYLRTDPPPGQPRLIGADASHAWVDAYHPALGWLGFDPTNGQPVDQRYVVLGWGGDFADVVPLRGVILGGAEQSLLVQVSVVPQG